jgi:nucleotide-binding universal stress UspA family protein
VAHDPAWPAAHRLRRLRVGHPRRRDRRPPAPRRRRRRRARLAPVRRRTPGGLPGPLDHAVTEGARKEDAKSAEQSEEIARRGAELAGSLGLSATPRSEQSDRNAGPALMQLAAELGAEVIVIGPRGLSKVAAALRDGTARHLASSSTVPVLVVPERHE